MVHEFELVLVRHGETDSNKTRIIQGHMDTPLSLVGMEQAKLVAVHLADQRFNLAISSDLQRALKTGEAIMEANDSISSIEAWEVVRERSFGKLEGQAAQQLLGAVKGKSKEQLMSWGPVGGETGLQFRERIRRFTKKLGKKIVGLKGEERPVVLVATHGGFIKEFNMMVVDEHNCVMPGWKGEWGRISPNTGVSRYIVTLNQEGDLEGVECTQLYFREHLGSAEENEFVLGV